MNTKIYLSLLLLFTGRLTAQIKQAPADEINLLGKLPVTSISTNRDSVQTILDQLQAGSGLRVELRHGDYVHPISLHMRGKPNEILQAMEDLNLAFFTHEKDRWIARSPQEPFIRIYTLRGVAPAKMPDVEEKIVGVVRGHGTAQFNARERNVTVTADLDRQENIHSYLNDHFRMERDEITPLLGRVQKS